MSDVKMILGFPASGKSTLAKGFIKHGYVHLNRDTEGGTINSLLPKMENLLKENKNIVLDNLFAKFETRKPFIDLAKKYNASIECLLMKTSIEDSSFNCVQRMINLAGKFLTPEEIKKSKHPNIFPPAVLFKYKKEYEEPTTVEGFENITKFSFKREDDPSFTNKAVILDYDGTLRECVNGNGQFPIEENQIEIKPGRTKVLQSYLDQGYILLGVSNQSGIHKGDLTEDKAHQLFKKTNDLLGLNIEYTFCPHQSAPPMCYCRKPAVGHGVMLINKHKLNRKECIFVGDQTTDKTFATRCGFQYVDQAEFFK